MLKMVEMDENITLAAQLEENDGRPLILINKFNVKPEDVDQLLRAWGSRCSIILSRNRDSFLHNFLQCHDEFACLSITQYGSLQSTLSKRQAILHLDQLFQIKLNCSFQVDLA
jgi:hypothetical protein